MELPDYPVHANVLRRDDRSEERSLEKGSPFRVPLPTASGGAAPQALDAADLNEAKMYTRLGMELIQDMKSAPPIRGDGGAHYLPVF